MRKMGQPPQDDIVFTNKPEQTAGKGETLQWQNLRPSYFRAINNPFGLKEKIDLQKPYLCVSQTFPWAKAKSIFLYQFLLQNHRNKRSSCVIHQKPLGKSQIKCKWQNTVKFSFQRKPFKFILFSVFKSWFRETKSSLAANDHHGKKASDLVVQIYEKNTH